MSERARLRDPIFWNDVTQLAKTAVAATLAWVLAADTFGLEQPFLAPWAAILVVHGTVYKTVSQGTRQVAATVAGVLLASAVGNLLGLSVTTVALAVLLGLVVGALPWFDGQETTVAATALVVVATGFSDDDTVLLARLLDTAIGIGVGIAVNLVVWPPLRRRTAVRAIDRIDDRLGELVCEMGHGLRDGVSPDLVEEWVQRTRDLDELIDEAWALVRQAVESARLNPRRSARQLRDPQDWYELLQRLEQAVAESRSLARTFGHSLAAGRTWDDAFRECFADLLTEAGDAIVDAEVDPLLRARARLDEVISSLHAEGLRLELWPEYGGVLTNLRNVMAAMDEVARVNPLGEPPVPVAALVRRRAQLRREVARGE
ncbi:FUSC family protein [Nocardioides litoris]|uniref:FUSC family protein n=1 Tax=Nocardioides litoris TaxID=1926648 RepID=UPI00111DE284|nr:aromatic acid exporter family protein [Nocardioides litoris]